MNRKYKFRAWNKDSKNFLIWDFSIWMESSQFRWKYGEIFENVEIMQFTWMKDKNWKEIYENDILLWKDWKDREIFHIIWDNKLYCYMTLNKYWNWDMEDHPEELEIIWNIYENPDMIK